MKKICASLIFLLTPAMALPYKITNSLASTDKILVKVLVGDTEESLKNFFLKTVATVGVYGIAYVLRREAKHILEPGQSAAWGQNEIRKLGADAIDIFVYKYPPFILESAQTDYLGLFPINANIEILRVGDRVRGRLRDHRAVVIDLATGRVSDPNELAAIAQLFKASFPEKLKIIEPMLKRANIKY